MLLIRLSLRNLLRQRRRNLLLGSAMAIGVAILVVSNAFSNGISDIMFNKIMRYVAGHVAVRFNERGGVMREIFRDKARLDEALKGDPLIEKAEESVGMFTRAIGNGKSDNIVLVGIDVSGKLSEEERREMESSFRLVEGNWDDIRFSKLENPVIISAEKARYLNVRKGDTLRVRFRNMFGQDQAARLTISGVMKNDNIFMQPVVFLDREKAKAILGYRPWESASVSLTIKEPKKNATAVADRIHSRLQPGIAVIPVEASAGSRRARTAVLGYRSAEDAKKKIKELVRLKSGNFDAAFRKDGVFVTGGLAKALGAAAGDTVDLVYRPRFGEKEKRAAYTIGAVCAAGCPEGALLLLNDSEFYKLYYDGLPSAPPPDISAAVPAPGSAWRALVSPEWALLRRTANTDEYKKKYQEIAQNKWKGTTVDVSTMYETASDILKLEYVLKLITLSAVLVLFFIILLGVVNTLRMTIRERTREIGTVRAIGMQSGAVRDLFILETFFLAVFASLAGTALGFAAIAALSRVTIRLQDNPLGMLLVNGHPHFVPSFPGIAGNIVLITAIAVLTAYFPARRAAALSPAQALRHFN